MTSTAELLVTTRKARAYKNASQARLRRCEAGLVDGSIVMHQDVADIMLDAAACFRGFVWSTAPASLAVDTGVPATAAKEIARTALETIVALVGDGGEEGMDQRLNAAEAVYGGALERLAVILAEAA